jgi:hypothetical protein
LVTSNIRLLQYFIDDKYLGYHILENEMAKYFVGDGENIIFRNKTNYSNLVSVEFEKLNKSAKVPESDKGAQFMVEAPIPATTGCKSCEYFRRKNKMCLYYQQIGINLKESCSDFKQKR